MGYLTRLSAGAVDQPIQAEGRPPVRAAVAGAYGEPAGAPMEAVAQEPVGAVTQASTGAEAVAAMQEPKPEAAPAPREEPVQEAQEIPQVGATPVEPIQLDNSAADDAAARQAHEAAEAKRKADWDAKQAEKKAAEQAALDKLAAMSDDDVSRLSAHRVTADVEKITRRSMKEAVASHIADKCQHDPAFARKAMHPRKGMVNCFRYISRKAYEYVQDELKADGIKPGPGSEGYGCDVPDGLCFQWAEDYFNDPDAQEDKPREEEFTPKPYVPSAKSKAQSGTKKDGTKKKQAEAKTPPKPKDKADAGQITLGGFAAMGEKAG